MEQPQQKYPVEAVELAVALLSAHSLQAVAQVVGVTVEKAALLDEVDEHHPVEHQRGVPFAVGDGRDALDEVQEGLVLLLEAVVEPPGDRLDVEGSTEPAGHLDEGDALLLLRQRKDQVLELLDQRFARLASAVDVGTGPVGTSRFPLHPLPALGVPVARGVHDEVLADAPGDGPLDSLADGMIRERVVRIGEVPVGHQSTLVGDGLEREGASRHRHLEIRAAVVPAQLADEELTEVQAPQMPADTGSIEGRRHVSLQ